MNNVCDKENVQTGDYCYSLAKRLTLRKLQDIT